MTATRIRSLVTYLLLGCVLTIVVASLCSWWQSDFAAFDTEHFARAFRSGQRFQAEDEPHVAGLHMWAPDWMAADIVGIGYVERRYYLWDLRSVRPDGFFEIQGGFGAEAVWIRAGWPFLAVQSLRQDYVPRQADDEAFNWPTFAYGALLIDRSFDDRAWPSPICIPLTPMWIGFISDAVFFALASRVLVFGVFGLRPWWRTSRQLCARCAYPLGGTARCPECGSLCAI